VRAIMSSQGMAVDRRLPQSQACRVQYAHQARRFHLHQTSITMFPCLYACAAHVRDCLRSLARQPAWFVHGAHAHKCPSSTDSFWSFGNERCHAALLTHWRAETLSSTSMSTVSASQIHPSTGPRPLAKAWLAPQYLWNRAGSQYSPFSRSSTDHSKAPEQAATICIHLQLPCCVAVPCLAGVVTQLWCTLWALLQPCC
jgi:hypothetical protein